MSCVRDWSCVRDRNVGPNVILACLRCIDEPLRDDEHPLCHLSKQPARHGLSDPLSGRGNA